MSILRRFSVRHFRSQVGRFALLAIWTLVVGIGAMAATSALRAGQRSQRLFYLSMPTGAPDGAMSTGDDPTSFSLPAFETLRRDRRAFSDVVAFAPVGKDTVAVRKDDVLQEATGEMVSANFFSGLGVRMELGGGFTPEDEQRHAPVVVLSFAYWTRLCLRNPWAEGQAIYIQGVPFAIFGVTAEGFTGVDPGQPMDFWIPLQSRPELSPWGSARTPYGSPHWRYLRLIARLAPGVDEQRAVAIATPGFQAAVQASWGAAASEESRGTLSLTPAMDIKGLEGPGRRMPILMALTAVLLLLACGYAAMRIRERRARGAHAE